MLAIRRLTTLPRYRVHLWVLCAALVLFQAASLSHNHALADDNHPQTCEFCLLSQNATGLVDGPHPFSLPYIQAAVEAVRVIETPVLFHYSSHSPRAPPV